MAYPPEFDSPHLILAESRESPGLLIAFLLLSFFSLSFFFNPFALSASFLFSHSLLAHTRSFYIVPIPIATDKAYLSLPIRYTQREIEKRKECHRAVFFNSN